MASDSDRKKWDDRCNRGGWFKRGFWNVAYFFGWLFTAGGWNPLKKVEVKSGNQSNDTITKKLGKFFTSGNKKNLKESQTANQSIPLSTGTSPTLFQSQPTIKDLLQCVAYGQQDEAEKILNANPKLASEKGTVTDYSGRTFENITAFQYALWALDKHMWKMILKYLPTDQAAVQLSELETSGTAHGKHFDFDRLIHALKKYVDNYFVWSRDEASQHWCKEVGGAQREVPAHLAQHYCNPDKFFSFALPTAMTFKEAIKNGELNRSLKVDDYDKNTQTLWFPCAVGVWLGFDCAITRGELNVAVARNVIYARGGRDEGRFRLRVEYDLGAVSCIRDIRTEQFNELKEELLKPKHVSTP